MNKRILSVVAALFCAVSLFSQSGEIKMPEQLTKLMFTHNIISRFYVDSVPDAKMVESGIKAMLKELDPHSTYSDQKEVKALMEAMQGSFEGIGVQFNIVSDTLYVIHPTQGGPSEKVGIIAGDRIVAVNDTVIA
jgi:carboxyl-terminal processing protease